MRASGSCTVTPDNGSFMVAAYVIAAVIVVGYATILFLSSRKYRDR